MERFQTAPFEEIAAHCGTRVSGTHPTRTKLNQTEGRVSTVLLQGSTVAEVRFRVN